MHGSTEIITRLEDQLRRRGVNPRLQVRAGDRIVDIVTDTAIYEVREPLTETALVATIPVIQTARNALDLPLNMVIVGRFSEIDMPTAATLAAAKAAGITVNFWTDESSQLH